MAINHRRAAADEQLFEIRETVLYRVPASSAAEAESRLLADTEREQHFFEAVLERQVSASQTGEAKLEF